jgi:hypothetical protein
MEEKVARMTEEEANALDDLLTKTDIKLKPGKGGLFTRQRELLEVLDHATADYITTRAMATNQMPAQIISELVHKELISNIEQR